MQTIKSEKGFTLVELAIVMIIIGLLIGGVLKGQQLIENAKVTATISQVKGFQAALNSFKDAYGATAGDMANADTRLSGCDTTNNCENGSGNSLVRFDEDESTAGTADPDWDEGSITASDETVQFWKHLALADLITGVDPTSDPTDPAWGESHPSSSLRGGYEFYYDTDLSDVSGSAASGHVLRMTNGGLAGTPGTAGATPANALQTANIDRKLDDGRPGTGTVIAVGASATDCADNSTPPEYLEQDEQKNCLIYFMIDG